jgi:hypothetical protein
MASREVAMRFAWFALALAGCDDWSTSGSDRFVDTGFSGGDAGDDDDNGC